MKIDEFNFHLPEQLIAQTPLEKRTASKMLVVNKSNNTFTHDTFTNLTSYLQKGDCIVFNDTKVIPARLYGIKKDTGANIEILLLQEIKENRWEALARPAKKVPVGTELIFGEGLLKATCVEHGEQGIRIFDLTYEGILYEVLDKIGEMPLPPYIKERLEDRERYQTIYAKHEGSAAAPTAGLHFTEQYVDQLREIGIHVAYVTLHVGLGTFRPVTVDNVLEHDMHAEYYEISEKTAERLNQVKARGGRIFSVGTTVTRALEANMKKYDLYTAEKDWTNIFIYPPYKFKAIDGMLTNFHLPKSTLLMLVSAFASKELIFKAYKEAIQQNYRFFSFGDCMLILS